MIESHTAAASSRDAGDCAATAAALLVHGGHAEHLLDVTDPAAVTDDQISAVLSELTGHGVRHQALTDEQVLANALTAPARSPLQGSGSLGPATK